MCDSQLVNLRIDETNKNVTYLWYYLSLYTATNFNVVALTVMKYMQFPCYRRLATFDVQWRLIREKCTWITLSQTYRSLANIYSCKSIIAYLMISTRRDFSFFVSFQSSESGALSRVESNIPSIEVLCMATDAYVYDSISIHT